MLAVQNAEAIRIELPQTGMMTPVTPWPLPLLMPRPCLKGRANEQGDGQFASMVDTADNPDESSTGM